VISRTNKWAKWSWSVGYMFFLTAGIVAFFSPSQIISKALIELLVYGWASFLTIGGGLCLGGKLRGNWSGEIIGLPLLSAANYIFGILILLTNTSSAAIAAGGIFCGVATSFVGRWIELHELAKINRGVNDEL
jgi:hypothetical protein